MMKHSMDQTGSKSDKETEKGVSRIVSVPLWKDWREVVLPKGEAAEPVFPRAKGGGSGISPVTLKFSNISSHLVLFVPNKVSVSMPKASIGPSDKCVGRDFPA